jgi:hypothetical protein
MLRTVSTVLFFNVRGPWLDHRGSMLRPIFRSECCSACETLRSNYGGPVTFSSKQTRSILRQNTSSCLSSVRCSLYCSMYDFCMFRHPATPKGPLEPKLAKQACSYHHHLQPKLAKQACSHDRNLDCSIRADSQGAIRQFCTPCLNSLQQVNIVLDRV